MTRNKALNRSVLRASTAMSALLLVQAGLLASPALAQDVPPPPEELVGVRTGTPDEGTNWTTPGIALGATLVVGLLGFGAGREFERVNVDRLRRLLPG